MGLGQYNSLGEYCDLHTASSVFLILLSIYQLMVLRERLEEHVCVIEKQEFLTFVEYGYIHAFITYSPRGDGGGKMWTNC